MTLLYNVPASPEMFCHSIATDVRNTPGVCINSPSSVEEIGPVVAVINVTTALLLGTPTADIVQMGRAHVSLLK